jgi:hypothetical protein
MSAPVLLASSRVPAWLALVAALFASGIANLVVDFDGTGDEPSIGITFWIAVILVVLAAIPRRVAIGAEGLRVAWLGRPRFVRYQQIERAAPVRDDVVLTIEGGARLRLCKPLFGRETPKTVLQRLWETLAAGAEAGLRPNERAALACAGRRPRLWVEALRALSPHGSHYRQGLGLDLERLWIIVENPAVETELRAGAAIAIASSLDGTNRDRLRDIASAAVEPRLRVALESVASAADVSDLETVAVEVTLAS